MDYQGGCHNQCYPDPEYIYETRNRKYSDSYKELIIKNKMCIQLRDNRNSMDGYSTIEKTSMGIQ